jgi:hypothetical protein
MASLIDDVVSTVLADATFAKAGEEAVGLRVKEEEEEANAEVASVASVDDRMPLMFGQGARSACSDV